MKYQHGLSEQEMLKIIARRYGSLTDFSEPVMSFNVISKIMGLSP